MNKSIQLRKPSTETAKVKVTVEVAKPLIDFMNRYLDFAGTGITFEEWASKSVSLDVDALLSSIDGECLERNRLIEHHGLKKALDCRGD